MQITINIPDNLPAMIVQQYISEFEAKLKQLQDSENSNQGVINKIPTSENNPEAFALFASICKSEKFTIDAACQAFSDVVSKKRAVKCS